MSNPLNPVLTDVFSLLRVRASVFFRSELASPWGLSLAESMLPRLHVGMRGQCVLGEGSGNAITLGEREIAMLPRGSAHWIADRPGRALVDAHDAGRACALAAPLFQEGDITHSVLCAVVDFDTDMWHPLLDSFPSVLHYSRELTDGTVWATIELLDAEVQLQQPLQGPMESRLAEALFLKLISLQLDRHTDATGFLAALRDRRLGAAIAFMHRHMAEHWSLDELGKHAGMSRATLVRRFRETLQQSPGAYLTHIRLLQARQQLRTTDSPIEQIALDVGFASASSLAKAYVKTFGGRPSDERRP